MASLRRTKMILGGVGRGGKGRPFPWEERRGPHGLCTVYGRALRPEPAPARRVARLEAVFVPPDHRRASLPRSPSAGGCTEKSARR